MFEKDLASLNKEQRQVVEATSQNLLVLAPAGTGKTKVIALRTAQLVKEGVAPKSILCLTFTNKAAKEMNERISLYIPKEARHMTIKTFHAFCYHLISHEKAHSHFSFPCTLIDEADSLEIVQKIIRQNGLDDDRLYYPALLSFFENVKRHSLSLPQEVRYDYKVILADYFKCQEEVFGNMAKGTLRFVKQYGLKLINTYTRYLKENNCIDFMDLIVEAKYLLENEEVRRKWHNLYKVIQVDEMQDTSSREYDILGLIARGHQLSMFGDFNQTIYEWRGSDPKSMTADFRKDFEPLEITLNMNYRSTKTLLKAANGYIASSRLYPTISEPKAKEWGDPITLIQAATKQKEFEILAEEVAKTQAENKEQSIAILTRTNIYAKEIAAVFGGAGIPCTVIEDTKFFRRKEIKDFLAFFDYATNDRNNHALFKICEHPYMNLPKWLLKELRSTKDCYMYLHDWFKMSCEDPYAKLQDAYEHGEVVVLDVESTGLNTVEDDIIQIAAIRLGKEGVVDTLDVLLKPTKSVGDSFFVHGFSDEQLLKEGLEPYEALSRLLNFASGAVLVGHNINYDLQIIGSMLSRYSLPPLEQKMVYDTLDLAYKVYPKLTNHKLDTLSQLIGTEAKPNHNALQDILATGEVMVHLLEVMMTQKQERFEKIEAYYCEVIPYKEKLGELMSYLREHTVPEGITYMMNVCHFKDLYGKGELDALRELYRIASALEEPDKSKQDQKIQLLTFSALHYSEIEQSALFKGRIPIITIHQSKGLEFDVVYIAGCNNKVFPAYRSVKENKLTEEMRLFYVAMTRAKKKLYLSYHRETPKSLFIDQIQDEYKIFKDK